MIVLSQERTKRMVAVHGWSAVVFGLFLYVVILTGAIAVLSQQIGVWSAGGRLVAQPLAEQLDPIVRDLAMQTPQEQREDVGLWASASGRLVAWFHTHQMNPASGMIEDYGTLYEVDPRTGEVLASYQGYGAEVFHASPVSALDEFIVDLHVNLHAPDPWGLYATGILGFVMLVAAITGLLMHRHIIKDVFLAPRNNNPLLGKKDRHVLAGTWSLLFSFILGFTGAFFSFAGALGLPLVAVTAFGGDQVAMIETLVGAPEVENKTPTDIANIDAMKALSSEKANSIPTFVSIGHWGRADAQVQIFHPAAEGNLHGSTHVFAGSSGDYEGTKPALGNEPSAGSALYSLMGPLHFGHFSGLLSKIVWVCLGLASCYVTATGMQLWLQRREENPIWRRMRPWVDIVVYGTPIALAGAAHAFFVALSGGEAADWTAAGFLAFSALSIILGLALPAAVVSKTLRLLMAALLIALPLTRVLTGGPDWFVAIAAANPAVVGMDILMLMAGAFYCAGALGFGLKNRLARAPAKVAV